MPVRPALTVFYSWASDLPTGTNQSFIEDALEVAVARLHADADVRLEIRIDRDTAGVPGAPDIAQTILAKIEEADIFVGDVSIIGTVPAAKPGGTARPTPNPNVLIELGFAAAQPQIGWDRTIPVLNLATGPIEELPFDIRQRRIVTYNLPPNPSPGEPHPAKRQQKDALVKMLHERLSAIVGETQSSGSKRKRRGPAPDLHALWVERNDKTTSTLIVEPARLPALDAHHEKLRSLKVSDAELALLEERWPRISDLATRHGRKFLGALERLPELDAVRRDAARVMEEVDRYITATPTPRAAFAFTHDVRQRRLSVGLGVVNEGTAKASGVSVLVRPNELVRFFTEKEMYKLGPLPPVRPARLTQLLRIARELEELARKLEQPEDDLSDDDPRPRALAIAAAVAPSAAHEMHLLALSRDAPSLRVDGGVLHAQFPLPVQHGFQRIVSKWDVWMIHALKEGEETSLPFECHAEELPEPDRGELVVRATTVESKAPEGE